MEQENSILAFLHSLEEICDYCNNAELTVNNQICKIVMFSSPQSKLNEAAVL